MASPLPPTFSDLYTATTRLNCDVSIMGRVTDFLPPSQSRGMDLVCTFSIADHTLGGQCDEGMKIRFFKPTEKDLPTIRSSGDVLLLRNIKIKDYRGMAMGMSTFRTRWTVFPTSGIPEKAPPNVAKLKYLSSPRAEEPSQSEIRYAIELCNSRDRNKDTAYDTLSSGMLPTQHPNPVTSTASSPASDGTAKFPASKSGGWPSFGGRDKFSLIRDLHVDTYYDIVGQVVKLYPNMGRLEMYITDYTSNNMLYRYEWDKEEKNHDQYGDPFGYTSAPNSKPHKWPGPYGQMTIMITLWPPHSHFAQSHVKEWDFVLLKNVHAKQDRDGKMEAALHEDRFHQTKLGVSVLDDHSDERVKEVLRRKREYGEKFKMQSTQLIAQARKHHGEGKPISKGQQRKKRKLEREKAAQERDELSRKERKTHRNGEYLSSNDSDPEELAPARGKKLHDQARSLPLSPKVSNSKNELNKNIHCSHHTVPTRPVSSILSLDTHDNTSPAGNTYSLPFQNIKSRATVRIVDFFPPHLADFAVPRHKRSEFDALSDYEPSDSSESASPPLGVANIAVEQVAKRKTRQAGSGDLLLFSRMHQR